MSGSQSASSHQQIAGTGRSDASGGDKPRAVGAIALGVIPISFVIPFYTQHIKPLECITQASLALGVISC